MGEAREATGPTAAGSDAPGPFAIRRLVPHDLGAYKSLRDAMLADHPEAFTSDAATERLRSPDGYLARLGVDCADGGQFTLGAWQGTRLVGALGCERDLRVKVRHVAHLIGMMVCADVRNIGVGTALLDACIGAARGADGIVMLTLTVTAGNTSAIHLYERAGFTRYGSLPRAILVDGQFHSKDHMVLTL
jgi:ribosomal protein S18 acetylase RimI-like enzyme